MSERFLNDRVTMHCGDCLTVLRTLPSDHFDCVVTSPPYWGLRDYGIQGQLGLERSLGEHIDVMVGVFSEVRRVLKPTGTLWLNYGDCYAANVNGRSAADVKALGNDDRTFRDKPFNTVGPIYVADADNARAGQSGNKGNPGSDHGGLVVACGYLKPKDLCGVPWRVAFALQESGWWLRQDIIWSKPNPMPESVRDRCTKAHEYLFLLTKRERYYFDAIAIREEAQPEKACGINSLANVDRVPRPRKLSTWDERKANGEPMRRGDPAQSGHVTRTATLSSTEGRNKRSIWEIATAPFPEAHFATFPPALIEPCVKAGCPEGGTVLDPFGGAGTTALVAASLGRNCTLIELNPEYCRLARARIEAAFMGKDEGSRHMTKSLGRVAEPGPLFAAAE